MDPALIEEGDDNIVPDNRTTSEPKVLTESEGGPKPLSATEETDQQAGSLYSPAIDSPPVPRRASRDGLPADSRGDAARADQRRTPIGLCPDVRCVLWHVGRRRQLQRLA